jgi:hypothetical protein
MPTSFPVQMNDEISQQVMGGGAPSGETNANTNANANADGLATAVSGAIAQGSSPEAAAAAAAVSDGGQNTDIADMLARAASSTRGMTSDMAAAAEAAQASGRKRPREDDEDGSEADADGEIADGVGGGGSVGKGEDAAARRASLEDRLAESNALLGKEVQNTRRTVSRRDKEIAALKAALESSTAAMEGHLNASRSKKNNAGAGAGAGTGMTNRTGGRAIKASATYQAEPAAKRVAARDDVAVIRASAARLPPLRAERNIVQRSMDEAFGGAMHHPDAQLSATNRDLLAIYNRSM